MRIAKLAIGKINLNLQQNDIGKNFIRNLSQLLITNQNAPDPKSNPIEPVPAPQGDTPEKDITNELYNDTNEMHDLTIPPIENSYLEKWTHNEKDILLPPFTQRPKYIRLKNEIFEHDFDKDLEEALIQCFQGKRYRKVVRDILARPGFLNHCFKRLKSKMKSPTYPIHAKSVIYVNKKKWYDLISKKLINGTFNFRPIQFKKLIKNKHLKKTEHRIYYVSFRDRMIMEGYRIILSKVYEMKFRRKEIFVPGRSHQEVLREMKQKWKSLDYFIAFPGEIRNEVLFKNRLWNIIEREIEDTRFFDMLNRMCKNDLLRFNLDSGIRDFRRFDSNVLFTLFLEIYLTKLDAEVLKAKYDFEVVSNKEAGKMREALKQSTPSNGILNTVKMPKTKTLYYVRHRHHFLLGIIGDKFDAKKIYRRIITFLKSDLKFVHFPDQAKLIHASSDSTEFLGMTIACPVLKKLPRVMRGTYLNWVSKTRKQLMLSQEILRKRQKLIIIIMKLSNTVK